MTGKRQPEIGDAYGKGGLGTRSTLSILRVYASVFAQYSRGFSPGTASSASSTFCCPPKMEAVAREDSARGRRVLESFMVPESVLWI